MFIDINGNRIVLECKENLKSSQNSQLIFWGFIKTKEGYETKSDNIEKMLSKIKYFFDKERVSLALSRPAKKLLEKTEFAAASLQSIKKAGELYKQGKYPKKELSSITSELKNIPFRPLKNHQLKAAVHLYLVNNGANFSVPGSGKTSVVLSVFEKLRKDNKVNTLFVVGPVSCFQPWRDEFKSTLNRSPVYKILAGGNPTIRRTSYYLANEEIPELFLTTYQSLLMDHKDVYTFMNRMNVNIFFVVDEAHYIKKLNGNWSNTVLDLSKYSKYRCVLTGTPIPRSFTDIFNLFSFLYPNNDPINEKDKIRISYLESSHKYNQVKEILKEKIGPLFYRVRKSDLGLKPATFHNPIVLKMNKYEKKLYDLIVNRILEYGKEDYLININLLKSLRKGRMIRLRQCVSYAKLLLTAIDGYSENILDKDPSLEEIIRAYDELEKPAKLEYLVKLITSSFTNQKVVIWSNFVHVVELIHSELTKNNIKSKYIYGKTPTEAESLSEEDTREKIIKEFLDTSSNLNVLIANPAACAESISLHKTCHKAIYYDLSYNCAQYLQSLDRIHRVGGSEKNDTDYYFLQYENTVDQDIENNLKEKAHKMNSLIEEDYGIYDLDMFGEDDEEQAYLRILNK